METTVLIDGKECKLKSSAAIPVLYRSKFAGRDILVEMEKMGIYFSTQSKLNKKLKARAEKEGKEFVPLEAYYLPEHIDTFEKLTYIMNKYADPTQPDDFIEWLEQFERAEAIIDAIPTVIGLWNNNTATLSSEKKRKESQ